MARARETGEKRRVRPFVKWAGGKGQLLPEIERYYPFAGGEVTKYAEPFVGGGAVLFDILGRFELEAVYLSDVNAELINAYTVLRDHAGELVERLSAIRAEYLPAGREGRKADYLARRARFNELKASAEASTAVERAALLIFLNRTCYNGLYRVNRKGMFNVPAGEYKNPPICDGENLLAASEALKGAEIVCGDYRRAADFVDGRTFVYFDPPYRPLSVTANFTAYTEGCFDDGRQRELARFAGELGARGARIVLSNSDPKNIDPADAFFDEIYSDWQIRRVEALRMINSRRDARGPIKELLISNFAPLPQ